MTNAIQAIHAPESLSGLLRIDTSAAMESMNPRGIATRPAKGLKGQNVSCKSVPKQSHPTGPSSVITSAATGRTLAVKNLGGDSNAEYLVRKCFDSWEEAGLHRTHEERVPIRQFNARHKAQTEHGAFFEHEVTKEMILALEEDE